MSEKTSRTLKTVRILAGIMMISAFLIIVISASPAAGFKGKAQPGEPYSFEKDEEYFPTLPTTPSATGICMRCTIEKTS